MRPRPLLALIATTALAGCNLAPKYDRPGPTVPLSFPQGGPYPPAASDAPDVTAIGWRQFFVDPRLQGVIALALENNQDLRLAAANVLKARAQYRVQRADLFPTIGGDASATFTNSAAGVGTGTGTGVGAGTTTSDTIKIYRANVGVSSFEIDLFGRVRNLSRAALEQYFASEEAQRTARISLIAETASAWLQLAADQDQLATARETLESFRQSLELTRAQFRIGTISELEVQQAETLYQGARNDIAALQSQIAQDQNALNLLAGTTVGLEMLPQGLGATDHTLPELPAGLSSEVLLRRPDVLQAEHLLIAEHANIGAARAALFPQISLTATFGTISTALSGLFGSGSDTFTVSPGATVPLFDFGRGRANVAFARASQQAAVATYQKTLQTAFREVADALATRGTIGEQAAARTARAEAAAKAARLSDARYRTGIESFLTSLDAQRTAYAARQDLVTARLARATNLVELYRAFGGGLN